MVASPDSIADRLFGATAGLAIVAAGVVTLGGIVNHFAFDDQILDLDPGLEISVNNWITVVASFAAALAAALHAFLVPARRLWFVVLAAIFALLSLDDLAQIHERVADNLDGRLGLLPDIVADHIETVIFAPLFAAALLIGWALAGEISVRAGRFLRLGLMLLLAAVVVDLGSTVTMELEGEGTAWPQATRIAVEEGLEVAGWVLVSATLIILVCRALLDAGRLSRPDQSRSDEQPL